MGFGMGKIKQALISVSDKTGIVEFAKYLQGQDVAILSTGGTASLLKEHGIIVESVEDYTGFPEIMGGRVKTLHPKVHGGLLARLGEDHAVLAEHAITKIDLLVVNLYPFEEAINKADCTLANAIENIDIGGPAMLRAAAKNYASVGVLVDHGDYHKCINVLSENDGCLPDATRFYLAQKAFGYTARYDANVSNYLGAISTTGDDLDYPLTFSMQFTKLNDLRYGENPHQKAAFYVQPDRPAGTLASARQLQGKALSYNNIADANLAFECVLVQQKFACAIVKHASPCGVALGDDSAQAYQKAYQADPTSAFGGVIALNQAIDEKVAKAIVAQQFVEVIIAPQVSVEASGVLSTKPNIRVLEAGVRKECGMQQLAMQRVSGGLLVQDYDRAVFDESQLQIVSNREPTDQEWEDMMFAWKVVKYVKSNAVVYAKGLQTIGVGAGQMSRVYSANIAALKAADQGFDVSGSVMASDAFLPFRDSVDAAKKAQVAAIIQPGGSVRDEEVIAAADAANIAMVFTHMRHFLH